MVEQAILFTSPPKVTPVEDGRAHDSYRESGIAWVGKVPDHWTVDRLRWTIAGAQNGIWGDEPDGVNDIICVRVADFDRTTLRTTIDEPTLRAVGPSERQGRILRRGDLLLEKSGGGELQPVGAVVQYGHDTPAVCSNFVARVRVAPGLDSRFLTYLHSHLYRGRVNTRSIKQTTGIQNLDAMAYFDERAAWPPLPEQRAIAAWLDERTRRIDELVAAKQRLIDLLAEQRTALITHAVTKGLDPAAPTRPSGIGWLGDVIPVTWEVKRLKHIVPGITVGIVVTPSKYYEPTGVPCLRSLNISSGRVTTADLVFIGDDANELHSKSKIYEGDVVVVRTGQTGTAAIVPPEYDGANCIDLLIIRKSRRVLPKFLHYFINSASAVTQIAAHSVGSIQSHYNTATVAELYVPFPPMEEQEAIVYHLDATCTKLDTLIAAADTAIARLTEYRQALISAAVTGKIDVRGEGTR